MKKYTRLLSWIIAAVLLLLSGFSAFPVFSQGSNQTLTQGFNGLESLQFGIVDEEKLWVAIGEALYLSKNQGQSWTNISPKQYLLGLKNYALFDNGTGTIISLESSVEDITTTLLKTNNFGMDWKEVQSNLSFVLSDSHAYPVESLSVQWLNERVGWLMAKQATGINFSVGYLFHTKDGGKHWTALPSPAGESFVFMDAKTGFMRQHGLENSFYYTTNGGKDWQDYQMPIEPLQDARFEMNLPVLIKKGGFLLPFEAKFDDTSRQLGFYFSKSQALQSAFQGGFELVKTNVLESLNQLSSTQIERDNQRHLFLNIDSLQFYSQELGWAVFEGGACRKVEGRNDCRYTRELHHTVDGGKTWKLIVLPEGTFSLSSSFSFEEAQDELESELNSDLIGHYAGQAFDACDIPSLAQLNTWMSEGPYRAVNMYIGGIHRACKNSALNEAYINEIARIGWRLIPTWVGHQAPCTTYRHPFSWDPEEAYQQGVENAIEAKERMAEYGLLDASGGGGMVWLDLENFDTTNTACVAASREFVRGWTTKLQSYNILSGLYATSSNLNWAQFYNIQPPPNSAWLAEWVRPYVFQPNASAYGLKHIADGYWYQQRVRQYTGGTNETWGNVTINIDRNVVDGHIMKKTDLPPSKPFVYATISAEMGIEPWYKTQVNVFINAVDYGSEIDKVYRKIDDGDWRIYEPFGVNGSSKKTISFYAVNKLGEQSGIKTISFYVDNQPPINPTVTEVGCTARNGLPQPYCNDASFVWGGAKDLGVGLNPEDTYQVYWGTDPEGESTVSTTETCFDPPAIPERTPHYLRIRTQDRHGRWSQWQTIYLLIYDTREYYFLYLPQIANFE